MRHEMDPLNPNQSLMERILSRENMLLAWKQVKRNKGAAGFDRMKIPDFPAFAREFWEDIRTQIQNGSYIPSPVLRVEIPKASGGTRPLGIPTVADRLIQQAIYQVLMPIFEPVFSRFSFGFRPGRSAKQAVYQIREYIKQGYTIAVDMDLSKFFDTVNHDILMHRVSKLVKDKTVLHLIGRYLRAGVCINGRKHKTVKGVPQGGPLSPLLANILLTDLDLELESRNHHFARYADDFTIMVGSLKAGERVMKSISYFLESKLKLTVNKEKSKVVESNQATFLGFTFKGKKISWSDKAFKTFKWKLKQLTGRSWGVSMTYRYKKLSEYIRGWMNYFGLSEFYTPIAEIDGWLRRRLRMCYWKQWRRCRTKVKVLLKLGVSLKASILIGMSRKGPWHLSRTLGTQVGMTNKWLEKQGLISVKELWIKIHYPTQVR